MIDLIEHNPLLRRPLLAVLDLCEKGETPDRAALEQAALDIWEDSYSQSPGTCVNILVKKGALSETVTVDGEPYEGSLEDMQLDENVADDAEAASTIEVTEIGRELLEHYAPRELIATLLEERPCYREIFLAAIKACSADGGCTRPELEKAIEGFSDLMRDEQTGRRAVYPQYFIDALETAGAIVWNGSWSATDAARAVVADG